MKNLKQSLTQPLRAVPTSLVVTILVIALIGFVDTVYLVVEHYRGVIPPCSIGSTSLECGTVLTSKYSELFGIPISLLGAIYYFLVVVGIFSYLEGKHEKIFRFTLILPLIGFITSLILVYLMAFVLKAWCFYCLVSVATSTALLITSIFVFKKYGGRISDTNHKNFE